MQPNRVKKILREGGLALGTYVGGIADPQIVEIIGHGGFDAAFIDMEHTSFDLRDVQLMVMAAERVGITPIVRTPGFDPAFILRLLDMGVQGIQVPAHQRCARRARGRPGRALRAAGRPGHGRGEPGIGLREDLHGRAPRAVEPRDHARGHGRGPARAVGRSTQSPRPTASTSSRWARRTCRARSAWPAPRTIPSSSRSIERVARGRAEGRRGPARAADEPPDAPRATPPSSGSLASATPTARRRRRCGCCESMQAQVAEARALLA